MSNEEKYMSWLPNGLNNFWYKEFDEILDDYSKSKDQQIKEQDKLIGLSHELVQHFMKHGNIPSVLYSLYMGDFKSYQQKYPKS